MRALIKSSPSAKPSHVSKPDTLAYAADLAVELYALCADQGFDELGARFLEAAAAARRLRATTYAEEGSVKDADPNAT